MTALLIIFGGRIKICWSPSERGVFYRRRFRASKAEWDGWQKCIG